MNDLVTDMPLGIYIHVPFCVRKCLYCDFLSAPSDEQTRENYVKALCAEIRAQAPLYAGRVVRTVFFGGGTPSLLSGEQMARIMAELKKNFCFDTACFPAVTLSEKDSVTAAGWTPEITMESNPGTLTVENLTAYRRAGINRLSIGLQSADDEELRLLGRIHTWEQFRENFAAAREAGFENINIDLMSALPGQSEESWKETLRRVAALNPEHISAYSLIIEEGTPFYELYGEEPHDCKGLDGKQTRRTVDLGDIMQNARKPLPTEEQDRAMYAWTGEYLASCGYERYEFSNYARPGYECRHNSSYWQRIDYIGFGIGSASLCQNVRWSNTSDLQTYLRLSGQEGFETGIKENIQHLSRQEQMEEFMFLGLRMSEGISCVRFQEMFGEPIEQVYGEVIGKLRREGLLEERNSMNVAVKDTGEFPFGECFTVDRRLRLTPLGVDVSNYALAEFLF